MQIHLTPQIVKRLRRELRRAGRREIGGLLMGEDLGNGNFRVVHISVQRSGGNSVCFVRDPKHHQRDLYTFFAKTQNDYSRFNYLGEWHSHPSFDPIPSEHDITTMQSLVNDPDIGSNFLVLLVAKAAGKQVEASVTAFVPGAMPQQVGLKLEMEEKRKSGLLRTWMKKILKG